MKKLTLLIALVIATINPVKAEDNIKLTELIYLESSPGLGAYPYRILVNDDYLRFDGGNDSDGYILFDRKKKQVVSVNHEDQSRFVIQPDSQKTAENNKIEVKIIHSSLEKAPEIQGIKATMHDIVANEALCRQVVSFKGLMPKITTAWKEYEELMQAQNKQSLSRTPKQLQTNCFITNNIMNAGLFLDYGLPYSIKSKDGSLRVLQNFSEVKKPASFVALPETYREFSL